MVTNHSNHTYYSKFLSPLGCQWENGQSHFTFVSEFHHCGVILFDRKTGDIIDKIPFDDSERIGNMHYMSIPMQDPQAICYQFYEEEKAVADKYARRFTNQSSYKTPRCDDMMRAIIDTSKYNWGNSTSPGLSFENSICYCLHVRGFTAHPSSGVKHKGTFAGVIEKIPYLKATGITTLEFQPIYEFIELSQESETTIYQTKTIPKLNYWGYTNGYYYAPKAAYSAEENAMNECKDMIRSLHDQQMEIILQFYFAKGTPGNVIIDILRFWKLEYRIDGFHLLGENLPINDVAFDPILADTKLWYQGFDVEALYGKKEIKNPHLAVYEDSYMYDLRRFLKGDEAMMNAALSQMRHLPKQMGRIHFLSNYYGFTLMDVFSYDRKHNEDNGEDNRDGNDYNCSWNCGEEGATRKKKILSLRKQMIKNAFSILLFSSSTPLLFMGDEFGNSQNGNNNPYCQDNQITWLQWKDLEKNKDIYEFFCQLVALRKTHPILHRNDEFKIMDNISCGYPDLSYHGENAWRPLIDHYSRQIGIMYCGKYAITEQGKEDNFFYIAINMHWEKHKLALPRLPKAHKWNLLLRTTSEEQPIKCQNRNDTEKKSSTTLQQNEESLIDIAPRSICIFISDKEKQINSAKQKTIK